MHQERGCTNQSHLLFPGMGILFFSDVVVCCKVESARRGRLQLKNAASGAFIVRDLHVGAERQCPGYRNAFVFVKSVHSRNQCGRGTFSHARESLCHCTFRMKSNHHKYALTATNPDVVAFLLSQKADIHAEDKNHM